MKKRAEILWGFVFAFTMLTSIVFAADKFAYVDLSRIFSEYGKTKEYDKSLNDKQGLYESERDKKVKDIKDLQDKMNLLSEKEKAAKKTDLEGKVKVLQEFDRLKQTDLRKEQDEKMQDILKDIEDAIKKYSAKENYTMVFNDRVLVYQDKNLDITDKIIDILSKEYGPKGK